MRHNLCIPLAQVVIPLIVALSMSASSLLVMLNALRVRGRTGNLVDVSDRVERVRPSTTA